MVEEREAAGTIVSERHGDVVVLRLLEEHDISTVRAVRAALEEVIRGGEGVAVSLTETRFLDSAITHALYEADAMARQESRRVVLHVATSAIVRRILELSGLATGLPCTASVETAVTLARARDDGSQGWGE